MAVFLIAYHLGVGTDEAAPDPAARRRDGRRRRRHRPRASHPGLHGDLRQLHTSQARSLLLGPFVNAEPHGGVPRARRPSPAWPARSSATTSSIGTAGSRVPSCAPPAPSATLSRGAIVGLLAGRLLFVFLVGCRRRGAAVRRRGVAMAWGAAASSWWSGSRPPSAPAASWTASRRARSARTSGSSSGGTRFRILAAHPAGIGRGAFDHVYPVYRTVEDQLPDHLRLPREPPPAAPRRLRGGCCSRPSLVGRGRRRARDRAARPS